MAVSLSFAWQPLDGAGVADLIEAASWAQLRIVVARDGSEEVLTRCIDTRAHTVVDDTVDSVLPLAEWLAAQWSALVEVPTQPPKDGDDLWQWQRQHSLKRVGSGSILPDLTIWRLSSTSARLRWRSDRQGEDPFAPVSFLSSGEADIPVATLKDAIAAFIDGVVRRLDVIDRDHPRAKALAGLWRSWQLQTETARARRLAAWRNLAWIDLEPGEQSNLVSMASGPLASYVEGLAMLPANWRDVELEAAEISNVCAGMEQFSADVSALRAELAATTRRTVGDPWQIGWHRASAFRSATNVRGDAQPIDLDGWIQRSGLTFREPLPNMQRDESVVAWRPGLAPVSWRAPAARTSGQRFRNARDLYGVLFCGHIDAPSCTYFSRRPGGFGSEARAFATELVAPRERVASMLARHDDSEDPITAIAHELDAPVLCVLHQAQNHELGTDGGYW